MSNLDERLREIVPSDRDTWQEPEDVISQIKEAFQDEGYVQLETPSETQKREWEEAHNLFQGDLLSGKEWYDRFEKEVAELTPQEISEVTRNGSVTIVETSSLYDGVCVHEAAKKAAGLDV